MKVDPFHERRHNQRELICQVASFFDSFAVSVVATSIEAVCQESLGMTTVESKNILSIFNAIEYVVPIIGSISADCFFGRYLLSLLSLGICVLGGSGLLVGIAMGNQAIVIGSLMGTWGIPGAMLKANLVCLGADQFDEMIPRELKRRDHYFSDVYLTRSMGSLISVVATDFVLRRCQNEIKFSIIYIMVSLSHLIAFIALITGLGYLFVCIPRKNPLKSIGRITFAAVSYKPIARPILSYIGWYGSLASAFSCVGVYFTASDGCLALYILSTCVLVTGLILFVSTQNTDWIQRATLHKPHIFSKRAVQSAISLVSMGPYLLIITGYYFIMFILINNIFTSSCQMRLTMGSFYVTPRLASCAVPATILVVVPLLRYWWYPFSERYLGGLFVLTPLRRLGTGLFSVTLALGCSVAVELFRKGKPILKEECTDLLILDNWCTVEEKGQLVNTLSTCYTYEAGEATAPVRDLNIAWTIGPYVLTGLGKVLFSATSWNLAYTQVTPRIRSISLAILETGKQIKP